MSATEQLPEWAAVQVSDYRGPVSGDQLSTADPVRLESAAMAAVRNSRQLMAEAEAWLTEAFSLDPEEIQLGQLQILSAVSSHYAGGLAEFYRNSYSLSY